MPLIDRSRSTTLVRFAPIGTARGSTVGLLRDGRIQELSLPWFEALGLLADGDVEGLTAHAIGARALLSADCLLQPLEPGSEVFCVGLNYFDHQNEAADLVDAVPDAPIVFVKSHRSVAAPTVDLPLSVEVSAEFDWEVELGVVLGHDAVDVSAEDAWRYIAGYCVVNDITARDLQKRHQQWHLGKNVPVSTPIGPGVVGRHSFASPPDVLVRLEVNGIEKQRGWTGDLIHTIPELVSLLSRTTSLRAGDIVATGTPAGVGFKRTPPEYLADGDTVVASIEGVGRLQNVVRTASAKHPLEDVLAPTAVSEP